MNRYDLDTFLKWKKKIESAIKWREKYITDGEKIEKRYRMEDEYSSHGYNILYSNTETLLPTLYSERPLPDCQARDTSDISARKGADMLDKSLNYFMKSEDINDVARDLIKDYLITGMGQIRIAYEPVIEEVKEGEIDSLDLGKVLFDKICFEYVSWRDFIYPKSKTWDDVNWIAYRAFMTYSQIKELFGVSIADQFKFTQIKEGKDSESKCELFEIWDKETKQQIFISNGFSLKPVEINDDPLGVDGFFPSPKPLLSLTTTKTTLPIPFYKMYQSQALSLDEINARIDHLITNMKRRGVYDKSVSELVNIADLGDNEFYPVQNWSEFSGKGGLNGVMQVEDITTYVNALQILVQQKAALLEDIYQIIGISDIRRGQADPRETLGAQKMKGKYGTIRISTYQRQISEFFRNTLKIASDIILQQFSPETLSLITGLPIDSEVDENGKVKAVGTKDLLQKMRDAKPNDVIIDVQTDTSILEDGDADKQALGELMNALGGFIQIAQALQQIIGTDATAAMLLGVVQKFKLGRNIQQSVLDHIEKIKNAEKEEKPQEPTPQQLDYQFKIQELEFLKEKLKIEAQLELANIGIKQQTNMIKAEEIGMNNEIKKEYVNLDAIKGMLDFQKLNAERENPKDNAIVGV